MKSDKEAYEKIIIKHREYAERIDTLKSMLQNEILVDQQTFTNNVESVYQMSQFTVTKTAYDNLLGSGSLNIISNDSLAEQILLYYRTVDNLAKGIDNVFFTQSMDIITPYMLANSDARNFEITYDRLKNDPFFENSISMKLALIKQQRGYYENQIKRIERLSNLLNQEIK